MAAMGELGGLGRGYQLGATLGIFKPKNEGLNEGLRCVPYRCLGVIRALVSPSKSVSLGTHLPKGKSGDRNN